MQCQPLVEACWMISVLFSSSHEYLRPGQLVGALLTDDFGTPLPAGLEHAAPDFGPIGALLDDLDERYKGTTAVGPGTHAHLFMIGVEKSATSRGIAHRLIECCVDNASRRGYTSAVTEATGNISQHIFRKLGFKELHTARYKEFSFNGAQVFSSIQGVDGTILMERNLAD